MPDNNDPRVAVLRRELTEVVADLRELVDWEQAGGALL